MREEWRDIAAAPGYQVSSLGRVRSLDREVQTVAGIRQYRGRILAPTRNQHGHLKLPLRLSPGQTRMFYVHALVAECFLGPRLSGQEVAHNDGNCQNNALSNLRYATPVENAQDKVRHGTDRSREDHPAAKLTEEDVSQIRVRITRGDKQIDIARDYGISRTNVSAIATGRSW